METQKDQFNTWVCTSPVATSARSATVFVAKLPVRTVQMVPSPEALDMGRNRLRLPSVPAGLKRTADRIRSAPPFGLPKREGRPERTSRRTGGVARSQFDPPQGGTGARAQLHGRWRDRSPLRIAECTDGPASPVFVPLSAALPEVRLNGLPGALAEVSRHRCDGGGRRVLGAAPTGDFGAAKAGEYPSRKRTPVFREATCLAAPLCDASASVPVPARFDHP